MLLKVGVPKSETVSTIQEWLNFLGFRYKNIDDDVVIAYETLKVDGKYGSKTERVVMDFQTSESIYSAGIIGHITMKALKDNFFRKTLELNLPGADLTDLDPDRFTLERVYTDPHEVGYARFSLRNDTAEAYRNGREKVIRQGSILTSSGGLRGLGTKVTQSRSTEPVH